MNPSHYKKAQTVAVKAARAAGALMRQNDHSVKKINVKTLHDIKLELDVRCQKLIEKTLLTAFPSSIVARWTMKRVRAPATTAAANIRAVSRRSSIRIARAPAI